MSIPDNSFQQLGFDNLDSPHEFEPMSDRYPGDCLHCGKEQKYHGVSNAPVLPKLPVTIGEIHEYAKSKGWWEGFDPRNLLISTKLMLMVSEIAEALEELREGTNLTEIRYSDTGKPEGFLIELVDLDIRMGDLLGYLGIDQDTYDAAKRIKHEYNLTRPHKHGGKTL